MSFLKLAYQLGQKVAFDESGLTPEQMGAAVRLGGLGGGVLGAGLGGGIGNLIGRGLANRNDWNPGLAQGIGTGLGALLGGGLGAFAGTQVPRLRGTKEPAAEPEQGQEASSPSIDTLGLMQTIPGFSPGLEPYMPEDTLGFLDDSGLGYY